MSKSVVVPTRFEDLKRPPRSFYEALQLIYTFKVNIQICITNTEIYIYNIHCKMYFLKDLGILKNLMIKLPPPRPFQLIAPILEKNTVSLVYSVSFHLQNPPPPSSY